MDSKEADTIVILSSELISKIAEEYFNKTMFKQKVSIVDLKPTESGYMFSVAFTSKEVKQAPLNGYSGRALTPVESADQAVQMAKSTMARLSNGKFAKVKEIV